MDKIKMLLQLDTTRIIQVFVVQLGIGILYFFIGLTVIRRDKKRLNLLISTFYISVFLGMLINVIYATLTINPLVTILHQLTDFFLFISPVFLLLFNLIILYSEKLVDTKKQLIVLVTYGVLLVLVIFFIGGITIDDTTSWKPVWDISFVVAMISLATLYLFIPTIYVMVKIYKKFSPGELKDKWRYFMTGITTNYLLFYGTTIANYLNDSSFRLIWAMISLILMLITAYGVYVGIGKQLSSKQ